MFLEMPEFTVNMYIWILFSWGVLLYAVYTGIRDYQEVRRVDSRIQLLRRINLAYIDGDEHLVNKLWEDYYKEVDDEC